MTGAGGSATLQSLRFQPIPPTYQANCHKTVKKLKHLTNPTYKTAVFGHEMRYFSIEN